MHSKRWLSLAAAVVLPLLLPVAGWSQSPVCDAGGPYYGLWGTPLELDGTGSSDPGGQIVGYAWNFGDGGAGSGPQPSHTYAAGGTYTITLTVTDDTGLRSICSAVAAVEGEISDLPRDRTLEDYKSQVAEALPPLDPGMVGAQPGDDWFSGMTVDHVAGSVDDLTPDTILSDGDVWIAFDAPDSTSTRYVKLDFGRDYLRYISQAREFDYYQFPHQAVNHGDAFAQFWSVIDFLGLPNEGMNDPSIHTVMSRDYNTATGVENQVEVERLISMPRQVLGYPVIGSLARVAINNLNQPARVLVKWPRFELAPDLQPLDRGTVVGTIADRIWQAEQGVDVEVNIDLAYGLTGAGYVPMARVGVTDLDGVLEGGLVELVPVASSVTGVSPEAAPPLLLSLQVVRRAPRGGVDIRFELPAAQTARLTVYDASGRAVRQLAHRRFAAGRHQMAWDGRDQRHRRVASGVYFVRLDAASGQLARKIVVVR